MHVRLQRVLRRYSVSYLVRWAASRSVGLATAQQRTLPDFVIIGSQRCGTTSLFNYLTQHPGFRPSLPKEVNYFSLYHAKGLAWYRSHFPLESRRRRAQVTAAQGFVTGEATPYYIFHPHAARRLRELMPNAKLVLLLRNPVDRAYSHYHYEVKTGAETLPFDEALAMEETRTAGEEERMLADESYQSFSHQHFTFLARGRYAEQIARWHSHFDAEQMLVLDSGDLYNDPPRTLERVTAFVGLPGWTYDGFKRYNDTRYSEMDPMLRRELIDYYRPYNRQLYDLVGYDFGWEF
jgi:hypothetical protein